ncbi:MAG TPA: DUF4031 domain-containing protein [Actinomycetales bacterium]
MAVLIDSPRWPAHGRLWAHLVSDSSLAELHAFAARAGIPPRSFEGDHYDVPAERHAALVAAGATPVTGRVLVEALQRSGLRLPKRKGERVLASWDDVAWPRDAPADGRVVDCIASTLEPPGPAVGPARLLVLDDGGRLGLQPGGSGPRLPLARAQDAQAGYLRVRPAGAAWAHLALHVHHGALPGLVHAGAQDVGEADALHRLVLPLARHLGVR